MIDQRRKVVIDWGMKSHAHAPRFPISALVMALLFLLAIVFKGVLTAPLSITETKATTGFDATAAIARLKVILGDERPHPDANTLQKWLPASAQSVDFNADAAKTFRCAGRACANWEVQVVVGATKSDWTIKTLKRGHGREAQRLLDARPDTAQPVHGRDVGVNVIKVRV